MLALAFAGLLCAAAGLIAAMPASASAQPAQYEFEIYADANIVTDPTGDIEHDYTKPRFVYVDEGADVTFMFLPEPNYAIDKVEVDGVDVTDQLSKFGTYLFSNVGEDHVVRATSKHVGRSIGGIEGTYSLLEGSTLDLSPTPEGGEWWITDPSLLSCAKTSSDTYTFTALKPGNPYAIYAVGDLIRRVSFGVKHKSFDAGNLSYEVLSENASGGVGEPGQNTVRLTGGAVGKSLEEIVISSWVSGNPNSPGTVYEVTEMASAAFQDETAVESVDFSSLVVTNEPAFVKSNAFRACTGLKQLVFGQKNAPTIVNAFFQAADNGTVYYPEGAQGYEKGMFKTFDLLDSQLPNWTFESYPAPSAPQALSAVPGDGTVDLSWTAPATGMGIQKYQYSATSDGSEDWKDVPYSDRSTTGFKVKNLANRTDYTFKVRAVNGAGESVEAVATATPGTPSAPENFAAVPGLQQVSLSWTAVPAAYNATKYQYSATADGSEDWKDVPGSDGSTTGFTVRGLTDGTIYTFKVRAVNAIGDGEATSDVAATSGVPAAPQNLTAVPGVGQVALAWDAVPAVYVTTKYQYSATADGSEDWKDVPGSDGLTTGFTVPGLTDGTTYMFKVRAVNGAGASAASSDVAATPGAPSAPQNLVATPGDSAITLSWDAVPGVYNATGYECSVTADGSTDWKAVPGSDGATTDFTVTGLENGTAYTLKVRALNGVGAGEAAIVSAMPPVKLVAIVEPRAVVGVAHGTPLADIPLPSRVTLETEKGERLAAVTWDRTSTKPAYDPTSPSKQTFTVRGSVVLPDDVVNPGGIPLQTSVSFTVDAKAAPVKPQPSDPSQPKPLVRTGDGALPLVPLGIAVMAGGAVLVAKRLRPR